MTNLHTVIMPHDAKEIAQSLRKQFNLSVDSVAEKLQVTTRTVYRILSGKPISKKLMMNLITLYIMIASPVVLPKRARKNDDE